MPGLSSRWGSPISGPDYSWLHTRNMTEYVQPLTDTTLSKPSPPLCTKEAHLRLVTVVTSSPENLVRRATVRRTWGAGLTAMPGSKLFFLLGRPRTAIEEVR